MKMLYCLAVVSFFCVQSCFAGNKYELGFIAGEPTGLSFKQNLGGN